MAQSVILGVALKLDLVGTSGHSHLRGRTLQMQRTAGAKDRTRASAVRVQETVPGSMYWRGLLGGAWGHWAFMQRFPPASKFLSPYNTGASPSSSYKQDQHLELSSEQHGCSEMLRESHGLWGRSVHRLCLCSGHSYHLWFVMSITSASPLSSSKCYPAPRLLRIPIWKALLPFRNLGATSELPLPLLHPWTPPPHT